MGKPYFLFLHKVQDSCGLSLLRCGRGNDLEGTVGVSVSASGRLSIGANDELDVLIFGKRHNSGYKALVSRQQRGKLQRSVLPITRNLDRIVCRMKSNYFADDSLERSPTPSLGLQRPNSLSGSEGAIWRQVGRNFTRN